MPIRKKPMMKEADDFEAENLSPDEPVKIAPSKSKVKPSGKATVRETRQIVYDADVEVTGEQDVKEKELETESEGVRFRRFEGGRPDFGGFRHQSYPYESNRGESKNTITHFFNILSDEDEETFLLFITRQPDMPSEKYNVSQVLHPANFPVMQITKFDAPNFVQMLQQLNGNSGGRFTVRATYLNGETIDDAHLTNFCVPNPPKEDIGGNGGGDIQQTLVDIFDRLQTQQAQQLQAIAELISKKKEEDEFSKIAKQLLMKKLLDDEPKERGFDAERLAETLFTSQQMIEIMTKRMAKSFDVEEKSDKPAWLDFLESDTGKVLADKAGNIVNTLAILTAQKMSQNSQPQPQQNGVAQEPVLEAPPQQIQSPTQTPEQIEQERQMIVDTTKLTQYIIDELETENPLDETNTVLQELDADYPTAFSQIKLLCRLQGFEQLVALLQAFVPEAFTELLNEDGTWNERGLKIEERLKEFYEFVKKQDS